MAGNQFATTAVAVNMTTMKAVTYDRFGDDSVLAVSEQPVPPVGPGEVLVRVKAAGLGL